MKFKLIIFAIIILLSCRIFAADVTDVASLITHESSTGTIIVAPGNYSLTQDIYFNPSSAATWTVSTAGDVNLDGHNTYSMYVQSATITFTGSATGRFIFTRGHAHSLGLYVPPAGAAVNATFTYCIFSYAQNYNGLGIASDPCNTITVTCNNCIANANHNDGFSLSPDSSGNTSVLQTFTLNNCEANDNDYAHIGGGAGDGVTAHNVGQTAYINGGSFHDNGKSAFAFISGSKLFVKGAKIYNTSTVTSAGFLYFDSSVSGVPTKIFIEDCNFIGNPGLAAPLIHCEDSILYLKNCLLDVNGQMHDGVEIKYTNCTTSDIHFINDYFVNCSYGGTAAIILDNSWPNITGEIRNCTFYNNYRHITIGSKLITIQNNIFANALNLAFYCQNSLNEYSSNILNGYNDFYNNASDFGGYDSGGLRSTDLSSDPCFVNATGRDFTLSTGSLCINAGVPQIGANAYSIGASQLHQIPDLPITSQVKDGVKFDNKTKTGTINLPIAGNVRDGIKYDSNNTTGTMNLPTASDVRYSMKFDSNTVTGTLTVPEPNNVRLNVTYDQDKVGQIIMPNPCDVLFGLTFDINSVGIFSLIDTNFVAESNLVSWYKMDENNDSNFVLDSKGYSNGTSVRHTSLMHTAGESNGALNFDGLYDHVNANATDANIFKESFTANLWLKTIVPLAANNQVIFGSYDQATGCEIKLATSYNDVLFYYKLGNYQNSVNLKASNYYDASKSSTWTMWTVSYERLPNSTANVRLYANGKIVDSNIFSLDNSGFASTTTLYLGSENHNSIATNPFCGALDDVRFYNRKLNPDEVFLLFYQQIFKYLAPANIKSGLIYNCYDDVNGSVLNLTGTMPAAVSSGSKSTPSNPGRFRIFK